MADFDRTYVGSVASRRIAGELLREGPNVSGGYSYVKKGAAGESAQYDIALTGKVEGDKLTMTESVPSKKGNDQVTGRFSGTLASDGTYRGTWSNPNGKKSFPFEWKVKDMRGRANGVSIVVANIRLTGVDSATEDNPVGWAFYKEDIVLLDRRNGFVVRTLELEHQLTVHGACDVGEATEGHWGLNTSAVVDSYKKAFPKDRVLSSDMISDGCERSFASILAAFVVEKPDHRMHAVVYSIQTDGAIAADQAVTIDNTF